MRRPYPALLLGLLALTSLHLPPAACQEASQKEPPYKRVLTGEDAPRVAELEQKAEELMVAGKFAEAQGPAKEAAAIRERAQGADHFEARDARRWVQTLQRLAALPAAEQKTFTSARTATEEGAQLYDQGKYPEAQALLEKALDIRRRALGEAHPLTAFSRINLACILDAQGRYAEARMHCEKALTILRRALGEEHPALAIGYTNLADSLQEQGNYEEAHRLFKKALAIRRQALGEGHPDTAAGYLNLAANLHAQGKYSQAEKEAIEAARSYEAARLSVTFVGLDRAAFSGKRKPLPLLVALLARNGKPTEAWRRLEESLARGLLDDLTAHQSRPLRSRKETTWSFR